MPGDAERDALKAEVKRVEDCAVSMLCSASCDEHNASIREQGFSAFVKEEKEIGCSRCLRDERDALKAKHEEQLRANTRLVERIAELGRCRKFAVEVAQALWDQEEPDGCDLQDMLEKHGIIEGHDPDPVEDADFIDEWGEDSKVYKLTPSLKEKLA